MDKVREENAVKPAENGEKARYAHITNPTVQAVLSELYRFESVEDALEAIRRMEADFISSRRQLPNQKHPSLILWIKSYQVTAAESKEGRTGNFAVISYKKLEQKKATARLAPHERATKYTLFATKLPLPLAEHPQRKREKKDHPDWGHPVLRSIKKRRVYKTIEEVAEELQLLHEEYPKVSIPTPNVLYIMVYGKEKGEKGSPIKKYKLQIKAAPEGGFFVDAALNEKQGSRQKPKARPVQTTQGAEAPVPQGQFTSKVLLAQRRKRK